MSHLGISLKIKNIGLQPDGTYRKLIDSSLAKKYGWIHKTSLNKGISITVNDFLKRQVFTSK